MGKWILITIGIVVLVFAGLFYSVRSTVGGSNTIDGIACLPNGHQSLAQHIHPELRILEDGIEKAPPANVGITQSCMRWLHTHEANGVIHLETPDTRTLTLSQFMSVWSAQGNNFVDGKTISNVTIDGVAYEGDYKGIILKDLQKIVLVVASAP